MTAYTGGKRSDGRYRPRDVQNLCAALKAACDGFVDAHVLPGDTARVLTWGAIVLRDAKESRGRSGVVVVLERISE